MDSAAQILPLLLGLAVLLPLGSFVIIFLAGPRMGRLGEYASYVATAAIVGAFLLSALSFVVWISHHYPQHASHASHAADHDADHDAGSHDSHDSGAHAADHAKQEHAKQEHAKEGAAKDSHEQAGHAPEGDHDAEHDADHGGHGAGIQPITGNWYTLGNFGKLQLTIGYYIDSLTVCMFCMVTLIASCIHFYASGYMHDELTEDFVDHECHTSDGKHLHRPGRYHRFFQYLSLFCFSMLGLVISGNIAMTFVFWELVGICSYFLIGFYVERKSASTAANKAFIVNRVGDFGMIIGLMAIWTSLGTFNFGDIERPVAGDQTEVQAGIFSQVRHEKHAHTLRVPDGMVRLGASDEVAKLVRSFPADTPREEIEAAIQAKIPAWRDPVQSKTPGGYGYWLLIIAGLGIFCGCVGKSAQFPLHTWLPDAMEGPTPVSALVHSATMVAAGVFLVARFYPVFTGEVLLVIAIAGTITLFMAATIAITATDIKRVLAYSTISQLGYMMLALGVGGWLAGVMHLFTHAFFKSLLFMCSGSVIHAVHTNEMTEMGGLRKKMPWTAYTMLIGCLAIAGAGIPFVIGFSGYYSKDSILEQAFHYGQLNGGWRWIFFFSAAGGAAITAFYMFRLWFLTFSGEPRDKHRYDHAHESPPVMYVPLVVLSVFAVGVAWPFFGLSLMNLLEQARPAGSTVETIQLLTLDIPDEHATHADENFGAIVVPATLVAFLTALSGIGMAAVFYGWRILDANDVRRQFSAIYVFLVNKWWFDELYDWLFVRPTHLISRLISGFDRQVIDRIVDGSAQCVRLFSVAWESIVDRTAVDGSINLLATWTYSVGLWLRGVQTGRLRQYVMFIVVGTVAIFVLASFFRVY